MKTKFTYAAMAILATIFILGCESTPYTSPRTYNYATEKVVNQSYDQVWSRLLEIFVQVNLPIDVMDKYNSILRTKPIGLQLSYGNCDCGVAGQGFGWYGKLEDLKGSLNAILTKVSENQTKVKLIFHYEVMYNVYEMDFNTNQYYHSTYQKITCNSTGRLEKMIFDALGN